MRWARLQFRPQERLFARTRWAWSQFRPQERLFARTRWGADGAGRSLSRSSGRSLSLSKDRPMPVIPGLTSVIPGLTRNLPGKSAKHPSFTHIIPFLAKKSANQAVLHIFRPSGPKNVRNPGFLHIFPAAAAPGCPSHEQKCPSMLTKPPISPSREQNRPRSLTNPGDLPLAANDILQFRRDCISLQEKGSKSGNCGVQLFAPVSFLFRLK